MRKQFVRPRHTVLFILVALSLVAIAGCNPMAAWTNNQAGKSLYRAGRFAEAREEFRRATADSPFNANYFHNYATASRRSGDVVTAEKAYRQALSIDPAHQPSYHGLAVTLKDTGRTAEAHSLLSSWVATQPYSEKAHVEMAWLQKELGDYAGAEQSLTQALKIKPSHPLALANLGQIYEETGRTQLAYATYQRSLATDWSQPQVASRLARLRSGSAAGSPVIAVAPTVPTVTSLPPSGSPVAYIPGQTGSAPNPTPGNDGKFASAPFRPTPNNLPSGPIRPTPNLPMARQPFQQSPNVPLASQPFQSGQVFLNVPSTMPGQPMFMPNPASPPPSGQAASPYTRQPR